MTNNLQHRRGLKVVRASEVEHVRANWVWRGWVAYGELTAFYGDPSLGKSTLTAALAAHITTGRPLPGDRVRHRRGNVLFVSGEDSADRIKRRVAAHGGDCDRVFIADDPSVFRLEQIDDLRSSIRRHRIRAVFIDPVGSFLGKIDGHRDAEVRRVLTALGHLAKQTGIAIVLVGHLNKGEGRNAMYRVLGSIAFIAAPRIANLIGTDPRDSNMRVMAQSKNNIGERMPSRRFSIETSSSNECGLLQWDGCCSYKAEDLLQQSVNSPPKPIRAQEFLRRFLADGPKWRTDVLTAAADHDIGERTLEDAKAALRVQSIRIRVKGVRGLGTAKWALPDAADASSKTNHRPRITRIENS